MARKADGTKIISARVRPEIEERASRVTQELARRSLGATITVSNALGVIIEKGLDVVEPELGISPKSAAKKTRAA
jgi:hypothetical protein